MALSRQRARRPREQPTEGSAGLADPLVQMPARELPQAGLGLSEAYELISSELVLDGQARLNLATFVTTWMPSIAAKLMAETADKNMIDKDEYPQTAEIESRCIDMIARLWNCPDRGQATGCSTTGSLLVPE
ncbi:MAG TPA: pyridoxal-dependent decarboxylase [Solirubrobacteraceae bacterium]